MFPLVLSRIFAMLFFFFSEKTVYIEITKL
jgi:hypothetical protein